MNKKKFSILLIFIALLFALKFLNVNNLITLENFQHNKDLIINVTNNHAILVVIGFIAIYIAIMLLQIPAAAILSFIAGALFNPYLGTVYVNIAVTTGSLLTFLIARYIFQDLVLRKFGKKLAIINKNVKHTR